MSQKTPLIVPLPQEVYSAVASENEGERRKALNTVHDVCLGNIRAFSNYYQTKIGYHRFYSRLYRIIAIVFYVLTAIFPVVYYTELIDWPLKWIGMDLDEVKEKIAFDPSALGYIFASFGAVATAMEKFSGCSTSWMRYITAHLKLEELAREFEVKWLRLHSSPNNLQAGTPFFDCLMEHVDKMHEIIEKETNEWKAEYSLVYKTLRDNFDREKNRKKN